MEIVTNANLNSVKCVWIINHHNWRQMHIVTIQDIVKKCESNCPINKALISKYVTQTEVIVFEASQVVKVNLLSFS